MGIKGLSKLSITSELFLAVIFLTGCISTATFTPTIAPSITPAPTATKMPVYTVKEPSGESYTAAQQTLNESQSAKDQAARLQKWLDYWVHFEDRPFTPDTTELRWKYIYDDPEKPRYVLVLIEADGKTFSAPVSGMGFIDPPVTIEGDSITLGFGPLEVSAGSPDNWLSVENGVPVRKSYSLNNVIIEKIDFKTGTWTEVIASMEFDLSDKPENFLEHYIPAERLLDGSYWYFVHRKIADKAIFYPGEIKKVQLFDLDGTIAPDYRSAPNYTGDNDKSRNFRRYATGWTTFTDSNGNIAKYTIMPIVYYNGTRHPSVVMTVKSFYYPGHEFSKDEMMYSFNVWKNEMHVSIPVATDKIPFTGLTDPLLKKSMLKYKDLKERTLKFINGDPSSFDEPDLILGNFSAKTRGNQYK